MHTAETDKAEMQLKLCYEDTTVALLQCNTPSGSSDADLEQQHVHAAWTQCGLIRINPVLSSPAENPGSELSHRKPLCQYSLQEYSERQNEPIL